MSGRCSNSDLKKQTLRRLINSILLGAAISGSTLSSVSAKETIDQSQAVNQEWLFEEIVITARKREESILDVPISITALTKQELEKKGVLGMDDYLRGISNVNVQSRGAGRDTVIIRGIAADPQSEDATVGIYFGETPIAGLGSFFGGNPDIKLVDIERVEVLRGPQGTLYGSGSLGGTLRIVPQKPDLNQFEGSIDAGYSNTDKEGSDNHFVQAIVNVPLVEGTLALRASSYQYENSGYYKNIAASDPAKSALAAATGAVVVDEGDVGSEKYVGGRIGLLWEPAYGSSIELSYLNQSVEQDGLPEHESGFDGYKQSRYALANGRANEELEANTEITSLLIKHNLKWANLLSVSSWVSHEALMQRNFGLTLVPYFGIELPIATNDDPDNSSFTQEIRLESTLVDSDFEFLVGLYYEKTEVDFFQYVYWSGDPARDVFGGALLANFYVDESREQRAFFGEASYDITDQLTLALGIRIFDYDQSRKLRSAGLFATASQDPDHEDSGQTHKVNLTYSSNPDFMLYAQWAEGFRLGFAHDVLPEAICDADSDGLIDGMGIPQPKRVDPDNLDSWELGTKRNLAGGRALLSAAIFYNQWTGIPIRSLAACQFSVYQNAGEARGLGFELEGSVSITEKLGLTIGLSYVDAQLTEDVPQLGAESGDKLPGVSRYNYTAGLEYGFSIANQSAFIRADYVYIDDFYSTITETGMKAGGYGVANIKAGISIGQWDIDAFINNLNNTDSVTWIDTEITADQRATRMRPRTLGLKARFHF